MRCRNTCNRVMVLSNQRGGGPPRPLEVVDESLVIAESPSAYRGHGDAGNQARGAGAIAPGVIGAALHEYVAGADQNLFVVEYDINFATDHIQIVDRVGLVHTGGLCTRLVSFARVGAKPEDGMTAVCDAIPSWSWTFTLTSG